MFRTGSFLLICLLVPTIVAGQITVSYIDVGQGDSILLQSQGHSMLIDAGPSDAGNKVVSFIKSKGIQSLDYVIATHPHEDHIGGMISVLNSFPISTYVDSGATHTTPTYENIMSKLVADQIPYAIASAGKSFTLGDVKVSVLSPQILSGDLNEDSIVLKVTDGSVSYLLPGDAENISSPATILKVGHHGSAGSINKINAINPKVAVIQVGTGNDYGHPSSQTLNDLKNAGVQVFRTDLNGDIVITSDGNAYSVITGKGSLPPSEIVTPTPVISQKTTPTQITTTVPKRDLPSQVLVSSSNSGACDCQGPDKNCKDFRSRIEAQSCYDYCKSQGFGDCFKLDGNSDGEACESLK